MARKIKKILTLLLNHPLLLISLLIRSSQLAMSRKMTGVKIESINGVNFEYDFAYAPNVTKMYFGLYEPLVVRVLKEFLCEDDIFIDVGSNIGYLSAVGAGLVGKKGAVYCFEPSLREFQRLGKLAALNPEYDIQCFNQACGEQESEQEIKISSAYGWNTLVPNWMRSDVYESTAIVNVIRLDEFLLSKISYPEKIKLIKIDVEGYEYYVLKGLQKLFQTTRPLIICEITPRGNALLGVKLETIGLFMAEMGYEAGSLINPKFCVDIKNMAQQEDVLFYPKSTFD